MATSLDNALSNAVLAQRTGALYKPETDDELLILTAQNNYVKQDPISGLFISMERAVLPAKTNRDDSDEVGRPFIVASREEDISSRLVGTKRPTYLLSIGVAWDTYEKTSMFCFGDGVIEYRRNIDKPSNTVSAITGIQPRYMVTYASIGIPKARFAWLIEKLNNIGLIATAGPKDQEKDGYVWMNANITRDYRPSVVFYTEEEGAHTLNTEEVNLMTVLKSVKQNIIGTLGVELTLKRSKEFSERHRIYHITPSLKSMQIMDVTTLCSPPLTKAIEFEPKRVPISNALKAILRPGRNVPAASTSGATTAIAPITNIA